MYGAAGEQNLGWTAEDDPAVVRGNRAAFAEAVGQGVPLELVTVRQVHGAEVRVLERDAAPRMQADGTARYPGDGLVSRTPGYLAAVLTADCVPVLVADTRQRAVGAFHAGWRGTLARVVQQGLAAMRVSYGTKPEDVVAAIGPCIGACCFEVGAEVRTAFEEAFAWGGALFAEAGGSLRMDLVEANRRQLVEAGVRAEDVSVLAACTACTRVAGTGRRNFFSHRAERGVTGRMLSGIAVVE